MKAKKARKRASKTGVARYPNGRIKPQSKRAAEEDATRTVTTARVIHLGAGFCEIHGVKATDPMLGLAVGVAIVKATRSPDERADLWQAVQHLAAVDMHYRRAIGAPSRTAKVAAILAPVSAMHADAASPPFDSRTEQERHDAAISARHWVEVWLLPVPRPLHEQLWRVVCEDNAQGVRWADIIGALWVVVRAMKGPA